MIKRITQMAFLSVVVAAVPYSAMAAAGLSQARQFAACSPGLASFLFLEPWYSCLTAKYGTVRLGVLTDLWLVALVIIEDAIKLGAYIAAGFIIWGGIKYIKSQGNASEIQQAQMVIKNALLGLVLSLIPVAVIQFIVRELAGGV